ncbi:putative AdoMet-dependent methyltransferase [Scopulibacillus daqui]|uniref:Uncharacterized methyltransferase JOD45_000394 n=1 Tax=Scopulibacillus daqui TaxID=1469162 RepID=A0ABS2PVW3_9BACL|nr:class I SAM-dependent methyltransferase [Scopulibacillus daqui]MBM7644203.1 putative AdoMet-dependent methyltransferase [Scopulibacillus daqui]
MGLEFIDHFNDWAHTYDKTVVGLDKEYKAVFQNYENILHEVAEHSEGTVLEFGPGTGNLTKQLLSKGHDVYAVEPSIKMMEKAKEKLPDQVFYKGDFLNFPDFDKPIHTIVSTYAFHHLTDAEKDQALAKYSRLLPEGGKIVFADTMFEDEVKKQEILNDAKKNQFYHLLEDLKTEYYPLKKTMAKLFSKNGFQVSFKQLNDFVWLMVAKKRHLE